jgi:hypothetical protein
MNTNKPSPEDIGNTLDAADEALALFCRLRRIPLDSLSDAQLGEFFVRALESEFGDFVPLEDRLQ